MSQNVHKLACTGLQWSLGLLLAYECSRLLFSAGAHTHLPHILVIAIAAVELIGAILFLIPLTFKAGGRVLLATFGVAALVHILHGEPNVSFLVIYAMAVLTVITA